MAIVDGKTLIGWGVVREDPWHFVGVFETQIEAAAKAIDMGEGYSAHHGESAGEGNFVWDAGQTPATGGYVVSTRETDEPYKVVLEHGHGSNTEHPVATMREGEALIKQETPEPQERNTLLDRKAGDA
jgi:hypothetical protein